MVPKGLKRQMGCFPSKLFHITLIASYDEQSTIYKFYNFFSGIFDSYDPIKKLYFIHGKNISNRENFYKMNRESCYPYKFKEEVVKKYQYLEKKYKENFPNERILIIFDKDLNIKVKVIEKYWKRYRWNYLRNLAAWKYHPSRLTFEIV